MSRAHLVLVRRSPAIGLRRIAAQHISHTFWREGDPLPVLQDVTLHAEPGEFVSIVGPSGCGKSTLLTILTGLVRPSAGAVLVDGTAVTGTLGASAYMPQNDLLLPWKRVLDNVALPLEVAGVPRKTARAEASRWFGTFGLEGFERSYPAVLSGGMRQRAALLRTFLTGREIVLLDEPLGALDAITRMEMQQWLLDVWEGMGKTILLVTHDVDEALFLSDRVYVMSPRPGRIVGEVAVEIPRPRPYEEVVTSDAFARLKRTVLRALREPGR